MILVDKMIRQLCSCKDETLKLPMLEPFSENVQGGGVISWGLTHSGYDLRLGLNRVCVFKNTFNEILSPKRMKNDPEYLSRVFDFIDNLSQGQPIIIPPNRYILGYSMEYIRLPRKLKGHCLGKSSNARSAVIINTTPLEPGWEGHLTIEVGNMCDSPIEVYAGEGICQLEFHELADEPELDYSQKVGGAKYQFQGPAPVPARVVQ